MIISDIHVTCEQSKFNGDLDLLLTEVVNFLILDLDILLVLLDTIFHIDLSLCWIASEEVILGRDSDDNSS